MARFEVCIPQMCFIENMSKKGQVFRLTSLHLLQSLLLERRKQIKTEKPIGVIKIEETELESEVITNGSNRQTETN